MPAGARIALAGLALALVITPPAGAAKVSFGPNLDNVTVNSTPAPTDTSTIQVISLEMLSPTTPIPLFSDPGALSYEDYPGPTQAGVVAPSPGPIGMTLTIGVGVEKPTVVTYGSAKFTAKAGKTAKVKVTLNSKGRALLHGHTSAKVWVSATFTKGSGAAKSARLTLKKH